MTRTRAVVLCSLLGLVGAGLAGACEERGCGNGGGTRPSQPTSEASHGGTTTSERALLPRTDAIASGDYTHCTVDRAGVVNCWGLDLTAFSQRGEEGEDDRYRFKTVPTPIRGLREPAVQVAIGTDHACALLETGHIQCWGLNEHGQLGDGTLNAGGDGQQDFRPVRAILPRMGLSREELEQRLAAADAARAAIRRATHEWGLLGHQVMEKRAKRSDRSDDCDTGDRRSV